MKRLLTLLVLLPVLLQAQTVWNKTYIEDRPAMLFSSVIVEDSGYKVIGIASNKLPPYNAEALIGSINTSGVTTKYITGTSSNLNFGVFLNTLIKTNQNGFAFTGYVIDTVPTLIFAKFDSDMDTVVIYKYTTLNTYVFLGNTMLQAADNSFYIAGIKTDNIPSNGNVCLVKLDSTGARLWEKFYNQLKLDDARSIIQLSSSNLMIGAMRNDLNQALERSNTWLMEVDTGGNLVRQWFDSNDSTYAAYGLLQTPDGGFIYGAQKKFEQSVNDVYKTGIIVKLDSNFNKQWVHNVGIEGNFTGVVDIEVSADGCFLACGNYSNKEAWVAKLSIHGNIIWERKYMGLVDSFPTWNRLYDIDILMDGSLVAVGECRRIINPNQLTPQLGWFLKLDSNGCEIENCLVGVPELPKHKIEDLIHVYPNPTSSEVFLDCNWIEWEGYKRVVYEVLSVTGQKMLEADLPHYSAKQVISIKHLPAGLYTLQISGDGKPLAQAKVVKE